MDNPGDDIDEPAAPAKLQEMFEESIDESDARTPVPWCADWRVAGVVWADTVDEGVTVMHPRQVRLGRAPALPGRLGLVATDVDSSWSPWASAAAPEERTAPSAALRKLWRCC